MTKGTLLDPAFFLYSCTCTTITCLCIHILESSEHIYFHTCIEIYFLSLSGSVYVCMYRNKCLETYLQYTNKKQSGPVCIHVYCAVKSQKNGAIHTFSGSTFVVHCAMIFNSLLLMHEMQNYCTADGVVRVLEIQFLL